MKLNAIDLFAGPGGWDLAARSLGLDALGIEWDDAASATRAAAGLRTLQADVSTLDPLEVTYGEFGDAETLDLLIGSPPCPSFSTAGKGDGIADMPLVYEAATAAARSKPVPPLPWRDERSALVVEPLRWAVALQPRFLAWEQVPPVLPFWEHCAELLRRKGWNVWTGIMEAERYGVPQARERAILMADREAPVHPPRPTHQRYVKGEPQRHEVTFEGEVLPWVSMAEALGWVPTHVVRNGTNTMKHSRDAQDMVPYERSAGDPAPTIRGQGYMTVGPDGSHREPPMRWKFRSDTQEKATVRDAGEPAPTLTANGLAKSTHQWVAERPATAVCGDPRISPPGYRGGKAEYAELKEDEAPTRSGDGAIRVSLEEAAILQSFPPDYPFQGTKSQRYLQVGNAVPPLLAHAILSSLLPVDHLQQYARGR